MRIASWSTNMFSMPFLCFWQIGMRGLLSFALCSTCLINVHVLLRWRRVLFLLHLQHNPILSLSLLLYLVTEDSVDTICLSEIARERFLMPFHSTCVMLNTNCDKFGSLRCHQLFQTWAFAQWLNQRSGHKQFGLTQWLTSDRTGLV